MKNFKNIILALTIGITACTQPQSQTPIASTARQPLETVSNQLCPNHLPYGVPQRFYTAEIRVLTRDLYCLSPNGDTKLADWVAYTVSSKTIATEKRDRTFQPDPEIPSELVLEPEDYIDAHKKLELDQGHLAPIKSLGAHTTWAELNFTPNIAPQKASLNRGLWLQLENYERELAKNAPIKVIAGPIFGDDPTQLPNADETMVMPVGFYKILISQQNGVEAFYMGQNDTGDFEDFATNVSDLEALAQIDFPDQLQL